MNPKKPIPRRILIEQWWGGLLILLIWAIFILVFFFSCSRLKGGQVTIEWDAADPVEQVTKWRIYKGIALVAEVTQPLAILTLTDEPQELSVVAINVTATSPPATIKLDAITLLRSFDLNTWLIEKVIHREKSNAVFYRLKIETP
jgi:hypothetical protein